MSTQDDLAARFSSEGIDRISLHTSGTNMSTDGTVRTPQEILATGAAWVTESELEMLAARLEEAERQIRTEHEYKAAIGGGPCVCKWCAALGEDKT